MTNSKMHNRTLLKFVLFLSFFTNGLKSYSQIDSLVRYADNIELGQTSNLVDSLMTFHIAKMHRGAGGTWRYIYNDIYQSTAEYQDKDWNSYTFRMLFLQDKLIYIDLHDYKKQKILFSKKDIGATNLIVNNFNKQYNTIDSFPTILKSFYTKNYDLGNPLDIFFANATIKQKAKLYKYAKSLCPEYSASAIIRLLELEKSKAFLTVIEKSTLRSLMDSDIQIKFIIGCLFR